MNYDSDMNINIVYGLDKVLKSQIMNLGKLRPGKNFDNNEDIK